MDRPWGDSLPQHGCRLPRKTRGGDGGQSRVLFGYGSSDDSMMHGCILPHAKSAEESIVIAAQTRSGRKVIELLCIPSSEDNIIGLHRLPELRDHVKDVLLPLLFSRAFKTTLAEI